MTKFEEIMKKFETPPTSEEIWDAAIQATIDMLLEEGSIVEEYRDSYIAAVNKIRVLPIENKEI